MQTPGLGLLTVRRAHLDGYRHTLTGAPATVARTLAALSSFYRYALSEEFVDRNPVATISRPSVDADNSSTQGLSRDPARTSDYGHDAGHRVLSVRRKGGKNAKVAVPAPALEARIWSLVRVRG